MERKDATVTPGTIRATAKVFAPTIRIRTELWVQWTRIAVGHEKAAREARDRGKEGLSEEFDAALVAISAVAFALDAFYGTVSESISIPQEIREAWEGNRTRRSARIVETLKRGFDVGPRLSTWDRELRWLFEVRDLAVHFEGESAEPVPHPSGTNVAPEQLTYSAEEATGAVALLADILRTSVRSPRASMPRLVAWADANRRRLIEELTDGY